MQLKKAISAGLYGTTAMTAFSYALSAKKKNDFREPALLAKMLHRKGLKKSTAKISGWLIHYAVGFLFTAAYSMIWEKKNARLLPSGTAMGGICGLIGVAAWKITLQQQTFPPLLNYRKFYRQLVIAHLFFGFFSAVGYSRKRELSPANRKSLQE
jgi:Na+/proline symporter